MALIFTYTGSSEMLDINVPNFITVGVISLLVVAFVSWALKAGGVDASDYGF